MAVLKASRGSQRLSPGAARAKAVKAKVAKAVVENFMVAVTGWGWKGCEDVSFRMVKRGIQK